MMGSVGSCNGDDNIIQNGELPLPIRGLMYTFDSIVLKIAQ